METRTWSGTDIALVAELNLGIKTFRGDQLAVIKVNVNSKSDVVLVAKTGEGKSVCYAVPSILAPGLTVVYCPMIAIMEDQVRRFFEIGAVCIHSSMTHDEIEQVWRDIHDAVTDGTVKLLLVSPERYCYDLTFRQLLINLHQLGLLQRFVIDEAWCISQWGNSFRRAYLRLGELKEKFPTVPVMACTATATEQDAAFIAGALNLSNPHVFIGDLYRPELIFEVTKKEKLAEQVPRVLLEQKARWAEGRAIVYVIGRTEAEELCSVLCALGFKAGFYHGKMTLSERNSRAAAFTAGTIQIMVATDAFGIGVDIGCVYLIIITTFLYTLVRTGQTAGRGGRNGRDCLVLTLFALQDLKRSDMYLTDAGHTSADPEHQKHILRTRRELRQVVLFYSNVLACRSLMVQDIRFATSLERAPGCRCDNCVRVQGKQVRRSNVTSDLRVLCTILEEMSQAVPPLSPIRDVVVDIFTKTGQKKDLTPSHVAMRVYQKDSPRYLVKVKAEAQALINEAVIAAVLLEDYLYVGVSGKKLEKLLRIADAGRALLQDPTDGEYFHLFR
jgi:RecQ family ATP-dependent DNA helicase